MQGLVGGGDGWGGPPKTYTVTLRLTSQSPYREFSGGDWVSAISGELARMADGYFIELIPISGFVNRASQVKLSYYSGSPTVDWTFNGRLTTSAGSRGIAGTWTQVAWSNGTFLHQFGTLRVRQRRWLVALARDALRRLFGGP